MAVRHHNRIIKAAREKPKERAISPQATSKAKKKDPSRPQDEVRGRVPKAKVKEKLTSVQMPRMELLLPQRLIVCHGMTNLKNHIRNIGMAVVYTAGTPRMV